MNSGQHELILARLHLEGVLGVIPEFFRRAPEAKELLEKNPFALRFATSEGLSQTLRFDSKGAQLSDQGSSLSTLTLFFLGNSQLNRLFLRNGLSVPLPLGNPLLLPKLLFFQRLMAVLEPKLKSVKMPRNVPQNPLDLWLQFLVALHGLDAVGTLDPKVIPALKKCPPGLAEFSIHETEYVASVEWTGEHVITRAGKNPRPADVRIAFAHQDVLELALRQELDQMAAGPLGQVYVSGFLPLAEALGIVSDRISHYLQP